MEAPLGRAGIDYVLAHLETGGNLLCDTLRQVVLHEEGSAFTFAPEGTEPARLLDFDAGGLLPQNLDWSRGHSDGRGGWLTPVDSLVELRARVMLAAMARHPGAVGLVDDVVLRWPERWAVEAATAFAVGEAVYHLITPGMDEERLADTLSSADSLYHGATAVCLRPVEPDAERRVSADDLRAAARSVVEITCTAYDREGFVVWRRG